MSILIYDPTTVGPNTITFTFSANVSKVQTFGPAPEEGATDERYTETITMTGSDTKTLTRVPYPFPTGLESPPMTLAANTFVVYRRNPPYIFTRGLLEGTNISETPYVGEDTILVKAVTPSIWTDAIGVWRNEGVAKFKVKISNQSRDSNGEPRNTTVSYTTQNGGGGTGATDALSGTDYTSTSGTLTFAAGESEKVVSVYILTPSPAVKQGTKVFSLVLSNAVNGTVDNGGDNECYIFDQMTPYGYPMLEADGGGATRIYPYHQNVFTFLDTVLPTNLYGDAYSTGGFVLAQSIGVSFASTVNRVFTRVFADAELAAVFNTSSTTTWGNLTGGIAWSPFGGNLPVCTVSATANYVSSGWTFAGVNYTVHDLQPISGVIGGTRTRTVPQPDNIEGVMVVDSWTEIYTVTITVS